MTDPYVHGYTATESARLADQARTLEDLIHGGTRYAPGESVLEAGCGIGAQTVALARRHPGVRLTCLDCSEDSLAEASRRTADAGLQGIDFVHADLFEAPFATAAFDHVFVCFVLEHLPDPVGALRALARLLKPGGSLTVVEGDHGTVLCQPPDEDALAVVQALVTLQAAGGGDALIGRRLVPLLHEAGLRHMRAWPLYVHAQAARPDLVDGFTRRTFIAMVAGVRQAALERGLLSPRRFDAGLAALERTTASDGSFGYGFFKAVGTR